MLCALNDRGRVFSTSNLERLLQAGQLVEEFDGRMRDRKQASFLGMPAAVNLVLLKVIFYVGPYQSTFWCFFFLGFLSKS